ncbi:hypothetical protein ARMSODRAFT_1019619 [Armillaria solidipes]|uniref:Uncharacterized protein n=1 Tax=Armillaria solidipes TaxID=1076256 RepID=A0A2H3BC93_9AGAR|nr:hypothetical protein ARMSODRAFT_1019619 [Armillaria solidipes]
MSLICSRTESRFKSLFSRDATERLETWDDNFVLKCFGRVTGGIDVTVLSHMSGDSRAELFVNSGYNVPCPEQGIIHLPAYTKSSASKHPSIPHKNLCDQSYRSYSLPQNADLSFRQSSFFGSNKCPPPNVNFVAGSWFNPNDAPSPPFPWKSQSFPDTDQVVAPLDIFPDYAQQLVLFGDAVPFLCHGQHKCLQKTCREPCPKTNIVRVHPYSKHRPKPREESSL